MISRIASAAVAALFFTIAADARASSILFSAGPGGGQPEEELMFSDAVLGNPVQGKTNQSDTLFDIFSNETLTGAGGQARVEAADGWFSLFFIQANDPAIFFNEFKANVRIDAQSSGTAWVTACHESPYAGGTYTQVGEDMIGAGKPCEQFSYALDGGQNFFVLSVTDAQFMRGVEIRSDVGIADVRQIRVSPTELTGEPVTTAEVPEPASLVLLGSGLMAGARGLRRRQAASRK